MNLATTYPPEAGVKRWMREVSLNRSAGTVRLSETFELARSVPVELSFMTSRTPSNANGVVTFHSTQDGAKDVTLKYDAAALHFTLDKIELEDEGMRRTWGSALYRVRLHTTQDVSAGQWSFEIA